MPTERDEILEGTKPVKFSNHKIKKKKKDVEEEALLYLECFCGRAREKQNEQI